MKTKILFVLSLSACLISEKNFAQSPGWSWAKGIGGNGDDFPDAIATDASGNVYMAGEFKSATMVIGSTILTNQGGPDMFIAKYDSMGNALWAKSAGGWYYDFISSLACDGLGNIYAAGTFASPSITFGSFTLVNQGSSNAFLVKYDSTGNVIWAVSQASVDEDQGSSVCIDAFGNIYVGGWTGSAQGGYDIFILKYDSAGNQLWSKSGTGNSWDYATSIAADGSGNIYLAGDFYSNSLSFGPLVLINSNVNGYAAFIVKLDSSGTALWGKALAGSSDVYGNSVTTDTNGNAYIVGQFFDSFIVWGQDTLTDTIGVGGSVFIAKYDSMGNELWAQGTMESYAQAYSAATDMAGNVYVSGDCEGDSILFGNVWLYLDTYEGNLFIVKYDANGNALWAINAVDSSYTPYWGQFAHVAVAASGSVYATGEFAGTIKFASSVLINSGGWCGNHVCDDIFLAKLLSSSTVSVESFTNSTPFTIYPNPSSGHFNIRSSSVIDKIEIRNMLGETIFSKKINVTEETVNLTLPSGFYLLQITEGKKQYLHKLIIQ
ncbi:MAG TPA: SBBP repeat-containing protein [Chitinophagales bacterium]|nr:SBBP repeat-containing protein [Chitinophagales bacterium]